MVITETPNILNKVATTTNTLLRDYRKKSNQFHYRQIIGNILAFLPVRRHSQFSGHQALKLSELD
jgi:hypothetical protein